MVMVYKKKVDKIDGDGEISRVNTRPLNVH